LGKSEYVLPRTAGSCEIHICIYKSFTTKWPIRFCHRLGSLTPLHCKSHIRITMSSSYGIRSADEDNRVPAQSQIAVTLLLPADDSPAFFSESVRKWQEEFLTGSQTYTLDPVSSFYGPAGSTQPPETVQVPVCCVYLPHAIEADIAVQQGICPDHFPRDTIWSSKRLLR